jgi:hypothetical protein
MKYTADVDKFWTQLHVMYVLITFLKLKWVSLDCILLARSNLNFFESSSLVDWHKHK